MGTGVDFRYGLVDACRAVTGGAGLCGGPPPSPAPSPAPPAPAPPQTAQPAPIMPAPPATSPRFAVPGLYAGSLARHSGRLKLAVADRGDALVHVEATIRVMCSARRALTVRVAALNTTQYAQIRPAGTFRLRTGKFRTTLKRARIDLAGRFDGALKRASGTVRVTGQARGLRRCDSRVIRWNVRRA